VERLINRLKQARRIATRYEKRGDNYLAMVHIGMILLWMKPFADTAWPGSWRERRQNRSPLRNDKLYMVLIKSRQGERFDFYRILRFGFSISKSAH
jgi:hypothetical protein